MDGWWEFVTDPEREGEGQRYFEAFPQDFSRMWVPNVWNTVHSLFRYEGDAWYRRTFRTSEHECNLKINFGAVLLQAKVWLDGEYLGEHYGGFTPFYFVKRGLAAGEHSLVVKVSADYNEESLPRKGVDWYPYGGICRPVSTELVEDVFIDRIQITHRAEQNDLAFKATMKNLSGAALIEKLSLEIDGEIHYEAEIEVSSKAATFEIAIPADQYERWDVENPVLHTVSVTVGEDQLCERFGVREIEVRGSDILLNGVKVFLKGVNRHDDHPDWGFAIPPHLIKQDLEIIKEAGFNSVRGSHYPQNELVLDLCDEMGLLYMDEIPTWHYSVEQLTEEPTKGRMFAMLEEMIERDYNHPSIFAWSVTNESATDLPGSENAIEDLVERTKELDPTRPVTFASSRQFRDRCFGPLDIASLNEYIGWYDHDESLKGLTIDQYLEKMKGYIGDKPILITEFGGGAVAGIRSFYDEKWTEEYNTKLLIEHIESFIRCGFVSGFFIWQFCDVRTHPDMALMRPRSFNNKGLVTEYRRPKSTYWEIKKLLEGIRI